ncbi:MAG: hypothetical protein WC782_00630 [Methylococcaceae bacterium]
MRRTSNCRRVTDRRSVPYEFGTPEWIEHIQKNYLLWPKINRRINEDRRANDRRAVDRREQQISEQRSRSEKKFSRILLTLEEKRLIEDLYLNDDDIEG